MTLQNLYDILSTVGFPVWQFESTFENNQPVFPYIVFQPGITTFNTSSGAIWREITSIDIFLLSHLQNYAIESEKLKKVLIKNNLFPTIVYGWYPDDKVFITQFDISITQEIDPETGENFNA